MKILVKFIRIIAWIVIIVNTIIIIGTFFAGSYVFGGTDNATSIFSMVLNNWVQNPLNFSNSDVIFIDRSIVLYVIAILVLSFVRKKK